ncbi:MAG: tRNA-specific 2-thiouridylase [Candidatus Omnitrophota bacterium]|jgi:tRNA-specific 2-thiouridylase
MSTNDVNKKQVKAVGLLSGGLDSIVAAKVIRDMDIEVHAVYFAMPWGCCDKGKAQEAAISLGMKFIVLQLDERYLEIVKNPKHGRGSALNPCVDCRIHMFSRAGKYMRQIGADFIFTGEVLGQRPMSQKKHSMRCIEKNADVDGRILRPLSAQLLDPTIPEQEGLIDRNKLLSINGRSRKEQISLAKNLGLDAYNQPAGGCLLTDPNFAKRMEDTFKFGYRNFRETVALQWGKHFRLADDIKVIIGRNEDENKALTQYAHGDDFVMELLKKDGPTLILKTKKPTEETLKLAGGLLQRFSKYKNQTDIIVEYWNKSDRNTIKNTTAYQPSESTLEKLKV